MRKFLFAILFFSLSAFPFVLEDNASVFTNELNRISDADFALGIRKLEALENRRAWGEAYNFARELCDCCYTTNSIGSGERWDLILDAMALCYRFENNKEDGTILDGIDKALIKYKNLSSDKRFFFYSKLYGLKMAYYWRRGDTCNHDKCLRELFLYDSLNKETLMTVLASYRERPANWKDSKEEIAKFIHGSYSNSPLFQTASIFLSDLSDNEKWESGLKWFESNALAKKEELLEHLRFMAGFLDIDDPEKTVEYCKSLVDFLSKQPDDKSRVEEITLALNEYYRVSALAGFNHLKIK
jgi:hypothetical protein